MAETIDIDYGELSEPQLKFCQARGRRICFGGSRGGGKTHVEVIKAGDLALKYDGVRIVIVRRTFPQLQGEIIPKIRNKFGKVCKFNSQTNTFTFVNGSVIICKHFTREANDIDFQGQNYDIIFCDEATQFTEYMYRVMTMCNRLSGLVDLKKYPRFYARMYFTCNPGGVGHTWVKRLWIDRKYKEGENPDDFIFVPSTVFDNKYLMEHDPEYVNALKSLPDKQRRAMFYGEWDAFEGQYFEEFDVVTHCFKRVFNSEEHNPLERKVYIDHNWKIYRARDYGLDMLACLFCAIDENGTMYVYKGVGQPNLTVSASGRLINSNTESWEIPILDIAPPDLWNRQRETGKSSVDILREECNQYVTKANNDRVNGWFILKEKLQIRSDTGMPSIMFEEGLADLINSMQMIQHDEKNVNDCAKEPHDITHYPDAVRYLVTSYTFAPEKVIGAMIGRDFDYGRFALNLGEYEEQEQQEEYLEYGDILW